MSPLFGPDAEKVLTRGAPLPGRIVGLRVRWSHDDPPSRMDEYAVEAGGRVYGIRQRLEPERQVRLGQPADLRVDGNAAVIEWGALDTYRWKALKRPPEPGIEDDSDGLGKARAKWVPGTATIERIEQREILMGLARATDAVVVVHSDGQEDYELTVGRVSPAFYAAHLFAVGRTLPVWVDPRRPDKLRIDWARAATDDPGVGEPPAGEAEAAASAGLLSVSAAVPDIAPDGFAGRLLGRAGITVDGDPAAVEDVVSWATFVAVQQAVAADGWTASPERQEQLAVACGVPSGEWAAARDRWMQRVGRDLAIGQAYRTAMGG